MAKNVQALNHAIHNSNALKHLDQKPDYLDWVITMGFYSALFYIKYKIFPLSIKAEKGHTYIIKTFDEYVRHNRHLGINKHQMLLDLTFRECPEIGADYNQLFDLCMTARYVEYKTDRNSSNEAKSYLKNIKDYCEPNENFQLSKIDI